ncbi:MAG: hypothetical protein ACK4EX_08400 [Thermaurantimonas sp.]|uniref:hypothetical protein n=1 Tax=Thermaurantimonas sp. TaxID=2681568 RepID=UPI00391A4F0F
MIHLLEKTRVYTPETLGVGDGESQISLLQVLTVIESEFKEQLEELRSIRGKDLKIKDVELQNQMPAPAGNPLVVRSYVYKLDKKGGYEIRVFVHSRSKKTENRVAKATYVLTPIDADA